MLMIKGGFFFWHPIIDSLDGMAPQGLRAGIPKGFVL